MNKREVILTFVILLLVAIGAGYFLYQEVQSQNESYFIQGSSYGYEVAVVDILQIAVTCPPEGLPIQYDNRTFVLVLIDCLGGGS